MSRVIVAAGLLLLLAAPLASAGDQSWNLVRASAFVELIADLASECKREVRTFVEMRENCEALDRFYDSGAEVRYQSLVDWFANFSEGELDTIGADSTKAALLADIFRNLPRAFADLEYVRAWRESQR